MDFCFALHKRRKKVRRRNSWGSLNKKKSVKNIGRELYCIRQKNNGIYHSVILLPNIGSLLMW